MNPLKSFTNKIEDLLNNEYAITSIAVFLVLYGGTITSKSSNPINNICSNPILSILVIGFIYKFIYNRNKTIALLSFIIFILSLQSSDTSKTSESESDLRIRIHRNSENHSAHTKCTKIF